MKVRFKKLEVRMGSFIQVELELKAIFIKFKRYFRKLRTYFLITSYPLAFLILTSKILLIKALPSTTPCKTIMMELN
jgi:hypothetical protein